MGGLRIRAGVCGVDDVVYSGSNVGNRDSWSFELYSCVSAGGVRSVP